MVLIIHPVEQKGVDGSCHKIVYVEHTKDRISTVCLRVTQI